MLSGSQFGFLKNWSTSFALMKLTEEITTKHNCFSFVCLFLIFKKELDTIDHKILISKLYFSGVMGRGFKLCTKLFR